jgi:outer membrane lipoprotein-sorting protein
MLQSWNGSDFTNDDLVRESSMIEDYTHRILGEEVIDDQPCWKLELTPKPEAAVVWGKLYVWVRKKDFLPSVVQFYDENGTLVRYLLYTNVRTLGGRTIPTVWTMHNEVQEGHHTTFEILDAVFDKPISDRIFSFRELERGD